MSQLICDLDHVEVGSYIIGHLESGAQVVVCESCFVPWALTMLNERLSPDIRRQIAAGFLEGLQPAPGPDGPTQPSPRRKRGRQTAEEPAGAPPSPQTTVPVTTDGS